MFITKYKKIFLSLSIILVVVSIVFIFIFGLKPGIDFKGGALMEVSYANSRPEASLIEASIKKINISQALIQPTGEFGYLIKTRDLNETFLTVLIIPDPRQTGQIPLVNGSGPPALYLPLDLFFPPMLIISQLVHSVSIGGIFKITVLPAQSIKASIAILKSVIRLSGILIPIMIYRSHLHFDL